MNEKNRARRLGTAAALAANIIFGFSNLFSVTALESAEPLVILSLRFTVAFGAMSLLRLLGLIRVSYKGKRLGGLIAMCLAQPFCYFLFELYGIDMTSSSFSGVMISTAPIAAVLLSAVFLKERPTAAQLAFSVISVIGTVGMNLFGASGGENGLLGMLLLLLAVLSSAVFNLLSRRESSRFTSVERTYFMMGVGAAGFTAAALAVYRGSFFTSVAAALTVPEFELSLLYLSLISSVAAYFLYNYATSAISVVRASSFSNVITVVSVLSGVLILEEDFGLPQAICTLLIIGGVCGVNLTGRRGPEKAK